MIPAPFEKHQWSQEESDYHHSLIDQRQSWHLWPFAVTRTVLASGSFSIVVEFRPIQKFALGASFFWKSRDCV